MEFGDRVKIVNDSVEGFYHDLINKTVTVVGEFETDTDERFFLVTGTGRPSNNPYLEHDEEVVYGKDLIKV